MLLAVAWPFFVPPQVAERWRPFVGPRGAISGVVVDESGRPVREAEVWLYGTNLKTFSDDEGRFSLDGVPVASPRYIVVARKEGFIRTVEGDIAVEEGRETMVKLTMLRDLPERWALKEKLHVVACYLVEIRSLGPLRQPPERTVRDPSRYPPKVRPYLKAGRFLNPDHPEVRKVARKILESVPPAERGNATAVARAVYAWVVKNIDYDLMHKYPNDVTCGNWQTTFGGFGHNFAEWCYTPEEVLRERRAICIEYERLTTALLRALDIPARPAPLMAHPVTQWWAQTPDGKGFWANMETSGGHSVYERTGNLWAKFPSVPDGAIAFWPVNEDAPIHLDWWTGRKCLWREDYGQHMALPLDRREEGRKLLRLFSRVGRLPVTPQTHAPPPRAMKGPQLLLYTRGFEVDLCNLGEQRRLLVKFPIFVSNQYRRTLEVAHWTNHPEWVVRAWREEEGNPETGESLSFYCVEFAIGRGGRPAKLWPFSWLEDFAEEIRRHPTSEENATERLALLGRVVHDLLREVGRREVDKFLPPQRYRLISSLMRKRQYEKADEEMLSALEGLTRLADILGRK